MQKLGRSMILAFGLALSLAGATHAETPPGSDLANLDPAMEVVVSFDGWSDTMSLESDGDVEGSNGQTIGEWFAILDTSDMGGGTLLLDLGGGVELDLSYTGSPNVGDGGIAILDINGALSAGSFEFAAMDQQNPCEDPRKEKVLCISTGTEQHSPNPARHIAKVIYVTKCGVGWYEVELADGTRHSLTVITQGQAGNAGKGTTSFDGKVSFVNFKPCP